MQELRKQDKKRKSRDIWKMIKSFLWVMSNFPVMLLWLFMIPVSFIITTWLTDDLRWHVAVFTTAWYGGLYACCWYNVYSISKAIGKSLKEI